MGNTTIAIPKELKDRLMEFGSKGETYAQILERLLKSAMERQLHDILFDRKNTITAKEALEEAKKKWQK